MYSGSSGTVVTTATVDVFGPTNTSTAVDSQGHFSVLVVTGTYSVQASAPGYISAALSNVVVNPGSPTVVSLVLESASTSSSSGTTTTSSSTTSSSSSGTTGTGPNSLSGPLGFTVQTALEFPAIADGGTADFSDVAVGLYDAPFTCQELIAGNGVPLTVHNLVIMEAHDLAGFALQGGAYTIPMGNVILDQDSLFYRALYPDGGYSEIDATTGTINYTAPVDNVGLNGAFTAAMGDGSTLSGQFQAHYCGP